MIPTRAVLVAATAAAALAASARATSDGTCEAATGDCAPPLASQGRALLQTPKGHGGHLALDAGHDGAAKAQKVQSFTAHFEGKLEGPMAKLMELERRVKDMHTEGQNPIGIANWINAQLLPMANQTKGILQGEVNQAQTAVGSCSTGLSAAENGAREQETTLSIGESRHNECQLLENQKLKKSQDDCQGLLGMIEAMHAPVSMADVDLQDAQAVEGALKQLHTYFGEKYQEFTDEDAHCTSSTTLAEQQSQQCEADMDAITSSYCSLRTARQQICTGYDACFTEKAAQFTRVIDDVRAVEAHVKSTFKTLSCLGNTVMKDMPGDMPSCNASTIDTTYLDVFYPGESTKESCDDAVSTSWNYTASACEEQSAGTPEGGNEEQSAGGESDGNATASDDSSGNASMLATSNASKLAKKKA
jgi:hypothetical protein